MSSEPALRRRAEAARSFYRRLKQMPRDERVRRAAIVLATVVAVVCVVAIPLASNTVRPSASSAIDPRPTPSRQWFEVGQWSKIEIDPIRSEIRVVEETPSLVRVEAVPGLSRYWVPKNRERKFQVDSGAVTVTVVVTGAGTEFMVDRQSEGTWVQVYRGQVKVSWETEQELLSPDQGGTFPHPIDPSRAIPPARLEGIDYSAAFAERPELRFRRAVARHDYRGAYAMMSRNPILVGDTPAELLVVADVARQSGHPSQAVIYLEGIVRVYPFDERAPQAAFTLGRTLSGLGRIQEAMNMFGQLRSTWPKSPLAEEALVRQAEAASQLGDLGKARRLAEQYDRAYPNGGRRAEVRGHAQLE